MLQERQLLSFYDELWWQKLPSFAKLNFHDRNISLSRLKLNDRLLNLVDAVTSDTEGKPPTHLIHWILTTNVLIQTELRLSNDNSWLPRRRVNDISKANFDDKHLRQNRSITGDTSFGVLIVNISFNAELW